MGNSITYDYRIIDKYTAPLNKIIRATDKIKATAEKASKSIKTMGRSLSQAASKINAVGSSVRALRVSTVFNKIAVAAKKATRSIKKMGSSLKQATSKIDAVGSSVGALGVSAVFNKIIGTTLKFDSAMNGVEAVTGATAKQMKALSNQSKILGSTTQFSASQAAGAMGFLGMAGLDVEQIMKAMPGTLQLAAAGNLDLAQAADIATNVMSQFGFKAKDLTRVNDALAYTAANANTDISQLSEALVNVGQTSSSLGVSLEDTTSMLGILADKGIKGGAAGTFLMNALINTVNTTKKADSAFKRLGINLNNFKTPSGKLKNFSGLMKRLKETGATTGDIYEIFGKQGAKAVLSFVEKGGGAIDKFTKKMTTEGIGSASKQAKIRMKGLTGSFKTFSSVVESLVIEIGAALTPVISGSLKAFSSWIAGFAKAHPLILKVVGALILSVTIIGVVTAAVALLSVAVNSVTWPILAAIAAVTAITALFVYWTNTSNPLTQRLGAIWKMVSELISGIGELFGITGAGAGIMDLLTFALDSLGVVLSWILKPLMLVLKGMTTLVNTTAKLLSGDWSGAWDALKEGVSGSIDIVTGADVKSKEQIASEKASKSSISQKAQNVNVGGNIVVSAEKGSKVNQQKTKFDTGVNMAFGGM